MTKKQENRLFLGEEFDLYMLRVRAMFSGKTATCKLLHLQNHLLGMCPLCGLGKYAIRSPLQTVVLDRVYRIHTRKKNAFAIVSEVISRHKDVVTNLEYPIPEVVYGNRRHIPLFYQRSTNTVIDVVSLKSKYMLTAIENTMSQASFNYIIYDSEFNVLAKHEPDSGAQVVAALKQILTMVNK